MMHSLSINRTIVCGVNDPKSANLPGTILWTTALIVVDSHITKDCEIYNHSRSCRVCWSSFRAPLHTARTVSTLQTRPEICCWTTLRGTHTINIGDNSSKFRGNLTEMFMKCQVLLCRDFVPVAAARQKSGDFEIHTTTTGTARLGQLLYRIQPSVSEV